MFVYVSKKLLIFLSKEFKTKQFKYVKLNAKTKHVLVFYSSLISKETLFIKPHFGTSFFFNVYLKDYKLIIHVYANN